MNILITGANGYIGSHLALELFNSSYNLFLTDRVCSHNKKDWDVLKDLMPSANFLESDLLDFSSIHNAIHDKEIDIIFHLAAQKNPSHSIENPLEYFSQNINTTLNILQCSKILKIKKFIFASSAAVYGDNSSIELHEDNFPNPINPYGSSKIICENIIKDFVQFNDFGFSAYSLRFFNPFGAKAKLKHKLNINNPMSLAEHILQSISLNNFKFNLYGHDLDTVDGSCVRDFIHIDDLVSANMCFIEKLKASDQEYGVFNIGSGRGLSVMQILSQFSTRLKLKPKITLHPKRNGDPEISIASINNLVTNFGWQPKKTLEDLVEDTLHI